MSKRRKNKVQNLDFPRILILVEGEKTEKLYFEAIRNDPKFKNHLSATSVEVYRPKDNSPKGLINEAKKKRQDAINTKNKYDSIWVVLDQDGHAGLADIFGDNTDYEHYKVLNFINIAFSSIAFEEWILLHFEQNLQVFEKSECRDKVGKCSCENITCVAGYLDNLQKSATEYYLPDGYTKNDHKLYSEHLKQRTKQAILNTFWQRTQADKNEKIYKLNPYTDVDKLVSFLTQSTWVEGKLNDEIELKKLIFTITKKSDNELNICVKNSQKSAFMLRPQEHFSLIDSQLTNFEFDTSIDSFQLVEPNKVENITLSFEENPVVLFFCIHVKQKQIIVCLSE